MTKLIVMIIMISGQGGPAVIQGWNSMAACNNAKPAVEAFFKAPHGGASYFTVDTDCREFPNNPQQASQ